MRVDHVTIQTLRQTVGRLEVDTMRYSALRGAASIPCLVDIIQDHTHRGYQYLRAVLMLDEM